MSNDQYKETDEEQMPLGVEPPGDLLTVKQVARWLQIDIKTIYHNKKKFGATKRPMIGVRIPKKHIKQMMEESTLDE